MSLEQGSMFSSELPKFHKAGPLQTKSNVSRPTKHFKSQTLFLRVLGIQSSWILLNMVNHSLVSDLKKMTNMRYGQGGHPGWFVRVPPYEISVFLMNHIFFLRNEIIPWGKKRSALFQIQNWEKSSFFNTLVNAFAQLYANMWQGGPWFYRVNEIRGKFWFQRSTHIYWLKSSILGWATQMW